VDDPNQDADASTHELKPRSQYTGTAKQDDIIPDCPQCGLKLRRDKNDPTQYYCWKAKDGCGYTGDGRPADNVAKEQYPVVTGAPTASDWDTLKSIGKENGWPEEYVRLKIESRRKNGMAPADIFAEMLAMCSKLNTRGVIQAATEEALREEAPF
jgi:hypothetical protein